MPASVVIVHDHPEFSEEATAALRSAGHDVVAFADPFKALEAIEAAHRLRVLVTRVTFPEGKPNGVSLALVARTKRPGLKVVFAANAQWEEHTEGIGELVPHPVDLPKLVETVTCLVQSSRNDVPGPK